MIKTTDIRLRTEGATLLSTIHPFYVDINTQRKDTLHGGVIHCVAK